MKAYSPSGSLIVATADVIEANALIRSMERLPDGSVEIEWVGEAEVCWDSQRTKQQEGQDLYVDEDGQEWKESELVWKDDGEGDEE